MFISFGSWRGYISMSAFNYGEIDELFWFIIEPKSWVFRYIEKEKGGENIALFAIAVLWFLKKKKKSCLETRYTKCKLEFNE